MEHEYVFKMIHTQNFNGGWIMMLLGFFSGGFIGLFFHKEDFWGGYGSFKRRIVRLGHIACVALGMINILFSISPVPTPLSELEPVISNLLLAGSITMPLICFLCGWKQIFRHLFYIPGFSLSTAVMLILWRTIR